MTPPVKNQNDEPPFLTNREMISEMYAKVNRMHGVVYGDTDANIPGISHRVKTLEDSDKKRTGIYVMISAVAAGIGVGIKFIMDHFK